MAAVGPAKSGVPDMRDKVLQTLTKAQHMSALWPVVALRLESSAELTLRRQWAWAAHLPGRTFWGQFR